MKRNTQLRKEWELYFGESLDGYELHHIISFYEGGTDDFSNLKKVTIKEHKLEHLNLYNKNGNFRDLCSYYLLCGRYSDAQKVARSNRRKNCKRKTNRNI